MPAALILNQAQAEAVYSAMCALNNASHTYLRANFDALHGNRIAVNETKEGIWVALHDEHCDPFSTAEAEEFYVGQYDFAATYGLNSDEWQSAVAAAAGGLTKTAIER